MKDSGFGLLQDSPVGDSVYVVGVALFVKSWRVFCGTAAK